jgi:hypothetical protein
MLAGHRAREALKALNRDCIEPAARSRAGGLSALSEAALASTKKQSDSGAKPPSLLGLGAGPSAAATGTRRRLRARTGSAVRTHSGAQSAAPLLEHAAGMSRELGAPAHIPALVSAPTEAAGKNRARYRPYPLSFFLSRKGAAGVRDTSAIAAISTDDRARQITPLDPESVFAADRV